MNIEENFLMMMAQSQVENPELLAQANAQVNPRTGKPYPTAGEVVTGAVETAKGALAEGPVALAKGAAQGFVGLPGDIVSLARGVFDLGKSGGDIDAFLAGLDKPTGIPTTEDVRNALNDAGLKAGSGESPAETVGEFLSPGGYVKGAKSIGKAAKKVMKKSKSEEPKRVKYDSEGRRVAQ